MNKKDYGINSLADAFLALKDVYEDIEVNVNAKRKGLKEAASVNVRNIEDVESAQKFKAADKKEENSELEVIDVDADSLENLQDGKSYIGKMLLQCNSCKATRFIDIDKLVADENDKELYNVEDECPHCHNKGTGYALIGQVGKTQEDNPEDGAALDNDANNGEEAMFDNTNDVEPQAEETPTEETSDNEDTEENNGETSYDETNASDDTDELDLPELGDEFDVDDVMEDDTEEKSDDEDKKKVKKESLKEDSKIQDNKSKKKSLKEDSTTDMTKVKADIENFRKLIFDTLKQNKGHSLYEVKIDDIKPYSYKFDNKIYYYESTYAFTINLIYDMEGEVTGRDDSFIKEINRGYDENEIIANRKFIENLISKFSEYETGNIGFVIYEDDFELDDSDMWYGCENCEPTPWDPGSFDEYFSGTLTISYPAYIEYNDTDEDDDNEADYAEDDIHLASSDYAAGQWLEGLDEKLDMSTFEGSIANLIDTFTIEDNPVNIKLLNKNGSELGIYSSDDLPFNVKSQMMDTFNTDDNYLEVNVTENGDGTTVNDLFNYYRPDEDNQTTFVVTNVDTDEEEDFDDLTEFLEKYGDYYIDGALGLRTLNIYIADGDLETKVEPLDDEEIEELGKENAEKDESLKEAIDTGAIKGRNIPKTVNKLSQYGEVTVISQAICQDRYENYYSVNGIKQRNKSTVYNWHNGWGQRVNSGTYVNPKYFIAVNMKLPAAFTGKLKDTTIYCFITKECFDKLINTNIENKSYNSFNDLITNLNLDLVGLNTSEYSLVNLRALPNEQEEVTEESLIEEIINSYPGLKLNRINNSLAEEYFIAESIKLNEDIDLVYKNFVKPTNNEKLIEHFKSYTGYEDEVDKFLKEHNISKEQYTKIINESSNSVNEATNKSTIADITYDEAKKYYGEDFINIESLGEDAVGITYRDSKLDSDDNVQETQFGIDSEGHLLDINGNRLVNEVNEKLLVSVKDRAELGEAINKLVEAKEKYRISKSLTEGYRYDIFVNENCKLNEDLFDGEVEVVGDDVDAEATDTELVDNAPSTEVAEPVTTTDIVPADMNPEDVETVQKIDRIANDIVNAIQETYGVDISDKKNLVVADIIQDLQLIGGQKAVDDLANTPVNELTKQMYQEFNGFWDAMDEMISFFTGQKITTSQADRLAQAIQSLDSNSFTTDTIYTKIASPRFLQAAQAGYIPYIDPTALQAPVDECVRTFDEDYNTEDRLKELKEIKKQRKLTDDEAEELAYCENEVDSRRAEQKYLNGECESFDIDEFDECINEYLYSQNPEIDEAYNTVNVKESNKSIVIEGLITREDKTEAITFTATPVLNEENNSQKRFIVTNNKNDLEFNLDL